MLVLFEGARAVWMIFGLLVCVCREGMVKEVSVAVDVGRMEAGAVRKVSSVVETRVSSPRMAWHSVSLAMRAGW